ncbi:Uncharacterised protein [Staphylococcus aureus]|nr:Uncharacterised protein [Staphylococcus aureus]CPN67927.1 Uncharacterised protein [Staphylococcus aureus]
MITFKLNIVTTKMTKPITSNFLASAFIPLIGSALVSGACLIKYIANKVNRIETTNIERQPIYVAIKPPNNVQIPLPPQEPIDQ